VYVGDDVWLGSKVTVLAGVCINDHATCGAGAVVAHDVSEGDVVGGVPARSLSHNT
jgi:acetyltransferase-like isoleucine patch superfamily enzyme